MMSLNLASCSVTGDIGKLVLPKSMQFLNLEGCSGFTGCLTWHCRVEPKVGSRIPGIMYEHIVPMGITPYINGQSYEGIKVGDEIDFPEPGNTVTHESLVGRRITVQMKFEGTIESFDPSTKEHTVAFDDGDEQSFCFLGGNYPFYTFVIEGADEYFDRRGVCVVRDVDINTFVLPRTMQSAILTGCTGVTGDIGKLVIPKGMHMMHLAGCYGLTGTLPVSERAKVGDYSVTSTCGEYSEVQSVNSRGNPRFSRIIDSRGNPILTED